ncbi:MAG: cupin domain-containing protein [Candidatus Thermoplasmatota archaeon]|nr:cupin domain-containing protein [Candidatus Thermoplasmatota archaeon]
MKSEIKRLTELVQYQEGTIVSKLILNKNHGTVTVFAFDKDQALSEHTAPFDALLLVLDGTVEVLISGKKHKLLNGDTIIMPADEPHAVKALDRFKMLLIMIK